MTLKKLLITASLVVTPAILLAQGQGPRSREDPQAAVGLMADLQRRLLRQALQPAQADQPADGQEPDARVDPAAHRLVRMNGSGGGGFGGGRRRGGRRGLHRRRRGHRRLSSRHGRHDQGLRADGGRHAYTSPHRTTRGRSTRATGASSGTTSGRRAAARTSPRAASACGTTTSTWRRRTTTSCRSRRRPARSAGTRSSPTSASSTSRRWRPIVIGNHVIAGTGNDLDMPGFLQSFDPETGELQWKLYTVPMNPGDPGLETWPSLDAARHGGAQPWLPGAYDPETKLYIFGTGNPTPAYTAGPRRRARQPLHGIADCRQRRYRARWPGTTRRRRTTCTTGIRRRRPSSWTRMFKGRMRKLVMTAARNGYFFVLDRITGEHLLTSKYGSATNWVEEPRRKGTPEAQR